MPITQTSSIAHQHNNCHSTTCTSSSSTSTSNTSHTTPATSIKLNCDIESGFCQYCGVDTSLFVHEFWCRYSSQ